MIKLHRISEILQKFKNLRDRAHKISQSCPTLIFSIYTNYFARTKKEGLLVAEEARLDSLGGLSRRMSVYN